MTDHPTNCLGEVMIKADRKNASLPTDNRCPFCGSGSTSRVRLPSYEVFWVSCDACHARGPSAKTLLAAIRAWNIKATNSWIEVES